MKKIIEKLQLAEVRAEERERIIKEIKSHMFMYEHHFKDKERLCEVCGEVVRSNTPCKESWYYTVWTELNSILDLLTNSKKEGMKKIKGKEKCKCIKPEPEQKQVTDNGFTYWVNGSICIKCQKLL